MRVSAASTLLLDKRGIQQGGKFRKALQLKDYYDPMYGYQLEKKAEKIVYRGTYEEIAEWLDR